MPPSEAPVAPVAQSPAAPVAPVTPGAPDPASLATPEVQSEFDAIPDDVIDGLTSKPSDATPPPAEPAPVAASATPPVAPEAPAAPAAAPVTPPATPAPVTPPATPAVVAPAAPVTPPVTPPAAVQPDAVLETPEQKAVREKAAKDRYDAQMATLTDLYKLGDDEAKQLLLEPEKVLPKLAAKLHMDVMEKIRQELGAAIPAHLDAHMRVQARNKAAHDMLYGAWPALNKPEYEGLVREVGVMFRKTNAKATPEEAVKAIGRLAYAALGWELPGAVATPPTPSPTAPTTPRHTPATPGGGGAAPRPAAQKNEFGDLAGDSPGSG